MGPRLKNVKLGPIKILGFVDLDISFERSFSKLSSQKS